MHCLSHTHKGAREVRGCGAGGSVLHVTVAMHHVVQITWHVHVAVLEGNFYLCVRGYFCAWILICAPEDSSVLLATPTMEHVKFVGDVRVTLLHVSFVPFIYRTSAPLRVHRCNHGQYSTCSMVQ